MGRPQAGELKSNKAAWSTAKMEARANTGGGFPIYSSPKILMYIRGQQTPILIMRSDLEKFGITDEMYKAFLTSPPGKLYLPTSNRTTANQMVRRWRNLFESFSGLMAVPLWGGVHAIAPVHNRNFRNAGESWLYRKVDYNHKIFPEEVPHDLKDDPQDVTGTPLSSGMTYRQKFNKYGGTVWILPPYDPDYRVAADRMNQLLEYWHNKLPVVEDLVQSSHTTYVEFRRAKKYSAQAGVSSKGMVYLILFSPSREESRSPVVNKSRVLTTFRQYVSDILRNQINIAEQAETKT